MFNSVVHPFVSEASDRAPGCYGIVGLHCTFAGRIVSVGTGVSKRHLCRGGVARASAFIARARERAVPVVQWCRQRTAS
jgi:hypothetical protein